MPSCACKPLRGESIDCPATNEGFRDRENCGYGMRNVSMTVMDYLHDLGNLRKTMIVLKV